MTQAKIAATLTKAEHIESEKKLQTQRKLDKHQHRISQLEEKFKYREKVEKHEKLKHLDDLVA